jgi:hypothetical protein
MVGSVGVSRGRGKSKLGVLRTGAAIELTDGNATVAKVVGTTRDE